MVFFFIGVFSGSPETLLEVLLPVSSALSLLFFVLLFIKGVGFQLARYAPRRANTVYAASLPKDQLINRYASAMAIGCAIVCTGTTSFIESSTRRREAAYERIHADLQKKGGQIELRKGQLHRVVLGPTQSLIEVTQIPSYQTIRSLKIRGDSFQSHSYTVLPSLRELEELDLSDTEITDKDLLILSQCKSLTTLNLARTKVTISGVMELLKEKEGISKLDLSGLNIPDNDIQANLDLLSVQELILRDNQITEAGASKLLNEYAYGNNLDLSNNPIDFSKLKITGIVSALTLEDLSIDDTQFTNIFLTGQNAVSSLTLANTKLTDTSLTQLVTMLSPSSLTVGDGNFTDDGFANIKALVGLSNLHVKGKQFTGSFLKSWTPQYINTLSFAHSSIQGAHLQHLAKPNFMIDHLDLSHCPQLQDADLESLNGAIIQKLSIIETPFTCAGLMNLQLGIEACEIYIGLGQFTSDEISLLRRKFTVQVGGTPQLGY